MLPSWGALKHQGPLLGYNNNVTYKGHVYHVQTEDSGTRRPRVITHLFADGGRVVSSNKTSYEELLSEPDLSDRVRAIMKGQHKAMVIALRDGEFDALIGHAPQPNDYAAAELELAQEQQTPTQQPATAVSEAKPTTRPFGARYNSGRRLDEVVAARLLLLGL